MVDFNNETTVGTPPGDVVKIVVLERREQVIEALEQLHRVESAELDTGHKKDLLRARTMAFWYEIQAMVKRRQAKAGEGSLSYDEVREAITKATEEKDLIEAYEWMNEFVDDMGVTVIDSRPKYDRSIAEDANQKKGL